MDNEMFLEDNIKLVLEANPDYELIRGTYVVTLDKGTVRVEEK